MAGTASELIGQSNRAEKRCEYSSVTDLKKSENRECAVGPHVMNWCVHRYNRPAASINSSDLSEAAIPHFISSPIEQSC